MLAEGKTSDRELSTSSALAPYAWEGRPRPKPAWYGAHLLLSQNNVVLKDRKQAEKVLAAFLTG